MGDTQWLKALEKTGLKVHSARDAAAVNGWLDTGNAALNWAISGRLGGGYPLGHTVEIFGDPATGKSFLVTRAIAAAQAAGGVALLDDTEGAFTAGRSVQLGVDPEQLAYRRSHTVKEHLDTALGFITAMRDVKIDTPSVIACDSLANLSTEHELEVKLDKRDMTKAAELKAFFRIVSHDIFDLPAVHISTNHIIANIGDFFNPRGTPGGGGPKYQASVRIDLRAVSKIRTSGEVKGVICRAIVDKNRIVAPWKEVRLSIPFERPISPLSGLIPLLIDLGVLTERGQFLEYQGTRVGRTYKSKEHFLRQDEQAEALLDQIPELLEEADALIVARRDEKPLSDAEATDEEEEEDDGEESNG